jgi:hypothetical protein
VTERKVHLSGCSESNLPDVDYEQCLYPAMQDLQEAVHRISERRTTLSCGKWRAEMAFDARFGFSPEWHIHRSVDSHFRGHVHLRQAEQ